VFILGKTANWQKKQMFSKSIPTDDLPVVGKPKAYNERHDEFQLYTRKNLECLNVRFWIGFGEHYINVFHRH